LRFVSVWGKKVKQAPKNLPTITIRKGGGGGGLKKEHVKKTIVLGKKGEDNK